MSTSVEEMAVNEKLTALYEAARCDESAHRPYIDYCNTRIRGCVAGEYAVELTKHGGGGEKSVCFDVRNVPLDVFQDRVAQWAVTGNVDWGQGPSDPLEW